jgi:GTP-binding protein
MRLIPKFLLSAMSPDHFPAPTVPEVAFLGRSNVGKSSLLNALVGSKQAHVSSTPGRTQAINFFALYESAASAQPVLFFADLPGYGYAKISKSISATWPAFIEPYLALRPTLALCICLVDSKIPPQESDAQLIRYLKETGRAFLVVGTKADRISGNERTKSAAALKRFLGVEEVLLCSAKTELGLKELWGRLRATATEASGSASGNPSGNARSASGNN